MHEQLYDNEMFLLFDHLENAVAFNEAMLMWHEDIMGLQATKEDVLFSANSVAMYWNSDLVITDIEYCPEKKCHLWTVV